MAPVAATASDETVELELDVLEEVAEAISGPVHGSSSASSTTPAEPPGLALASQSARAAPSFDDDMPDIDVDLADTAELPEAPGEAPAATNGGGAEPHFSAVGGGSAAGDAAAPDVKAAEGGGIRDAAHSPTPDEGPPHEAAAAKAVPPSPPPGSGASKGSSRITSEVRPRRRRRAKAWFEDVFDEDYLRTLPTMTAAQTRREARFIEDSLGVTPGGALLDAGCGYGRHCMELAARGYRLVGLDLSLPLLLRAADEAQRRGLSINFVHGDLRELVFEESFDGAYCLFSTFGYFDDDSNRRVLDGVARALKPRGRLIIDAFNRDYVVRDLPARAWWEGDGCVVLEEVEFNYFTSRLLSKRSLVFEDGRQREQQISIRAYSLHELGRALQSAGFRILEVSGDVTTRARFFGVDSRSLVILAEKRPAK
jgi:SAM-dependent methyltransferase